MTFEDKVGDLRVANQGEFRVPLSFFGEEVKKIPLRYEGDIRLFVAQPFQGAEVAEGAQLSVAVERDVIDFLMGSVRNSSMSPMSSMIRIVVGCTVSPRKSRKKSPCFSRTTTLIPALASNRACISPAGPPCGDTHLSS